MLVPVEQYGVEAAMDDTKAAATLLLDQRRLKPGPVGGEPLSRAARTSSSGTPAFSLTPALTL